MLFRSLMDFAAQTWEVDLQTGPILDTDIEILEIGNASVRFKILKDVPSGYSWSGIITILKFKGLSDGTGFIELA